MVQVIKNGKREELANMKGLPNGEQIIISGLDVNRIQFVRQWEITQNRKNPETGAFEDVQVPQFHFSFGGLSFTITGEGLLSDGEALLATVKKTAKGGDRVKEVYLIVNEWHPALLDAEGNAVMENDAPVLNMEVTNTSFTYSGQASALQVAEEQDLNMEVTNTSFTYSGQASALQVAEEQDDNLAYEAKKNKIMVAEGATMEALIAKYMTNNPVAATATA